MPLLAYAIRRASRAAIAMEARGLETGLRRTILDAQRFGRGDLAFSVVAFALLAAALVAVAG